jgi:hypothetical protein
LVSRFASRFDGCILRWFNRFQVNSPPLLVQAFRHIFVSN